MFIDCSALVGSADERLFIGLQRFTLWWWRWFRLDDTDSFTVTSQ